MSRPDKINFASFWERPYPILTVTAAMWGANAIFGRLAVNEISPLLLTFLRWGFVCCFAWFLAGRYLKEYWPVLKPKLLMITLMGLFGFTGFNAFMYAAAHRTTAVNISILQGSQPIMVIIGAIFLFGLKISWHQVAGILLTLVGVATIAFKGELSTLLTMSFNSGDVFMLIASLFYAGYTLALRNKPAVPGLLFFALLTTTATITSFPLAVYEYATDTIIWPTLKGCLITAGIIIFPSCLAQIFFIRGVELIGPPRAGLFINLIPVFGTAFAIIFLHEPFTLMHAFGLALVLFGIWLAERK